MKRYALSLTFVLALLWLLFSGKGLHPILLPLGALSVALVVYLSYRLKITDRDTEPTRLLIPSIRYWPWLMGQIVRANLQVARRVFESPQRLSPSIATVRISQRTNIGRTIMANSITLTPGTVTLRVRDDEIDYYSLSADLVDDLNQGEMDRRVSHLERTL